MSIFGIRIFLYTILPLLAAGIQIGMDKSTRSRERKLEVFLLYLFGLGVAGSGLGGFFAHFFLSDLVAESIGWPAGNPFQLEIAFANLAIGILGIGCVGRRDGFRALAVGVLTAVVATGFGVGFAIEQPLLGTALGIIAGAVLATFIISRAPGESGTAPTDGPS